MTLGPVLSLERRMCWSARVKRAVLRPSRGLIPMALSRWASASSVSAAVLLQGRRGPGCHPGQNARHPRPSRDPVQKLSAGDWAAYAADVSRRSSLQAVPLPRRNAGPHVDPRHPADRASRGCFSDDPAAIWRLGLQAYRVGSSPGKPGNAPPTARYSSAAAASTRSSSPARCSCASCECAEACR